MTGKHRRQMNPLSTKTRSARSWPTNGGLVGLRGLIAIIFGLICFFVAPARNPHGRPLLLGLYAGRWRSGHHVWDQGRAQRQAMGLADSRGHRRHCGGPIAFVWPGMAAIVFVLMIGIWAVISGGLLVYRCALPETRPWPLVARACGCRLRHFRHPVVCRTRRWAPSC